MGFVPRFHEFHCWEISVGVPMKALAISGFVFALGLSMAVAADAPLKGFSHDNKTEISGYYMPVKPITVGKFTLENLSIGGLDDLKKYETGKGRIPTYAPVMFVFQDTTSKKLKNEMGDDYYANEPRVLPAAYRIRGNTIAFEGKDRQVGAVSFTGTIDPKIVKALMDQGIMDTDKIVIKGDLTIAGKVFKGVNFRWFGGD